ncbi:MAG: guanylate kinase [Verrucomicrobiales bacterium]|nr:guanylate kinase [Verrucomicrobiales bacterium]
MPPARPGLSRLIAPVLFLITAPSGAGKTTVSRNLLERTPGLVRAITCTTRPPRGNERDGVDYHFLSSEIFEARVAAGQFLEHAQVYANRYGTLKSEVLSRLAAGNDVLLSVDVQGAAAIRAMAGRDPALAQSLVTAFIMPPSYAELERRLRGRGEDAPEVVATRLAAARAEMETWRQCDYLIVSGTEQEDFDAMQRILAVERLKTVRTRTLRLDGHAFEPALHPAPAPTHAAHDHAS